MLRISQKEGRFRTVVRIDGRLTGEYVGLAADCCRRALELGKPVHLLLKDVSALDDAGRELLRSLAGRGVRLHASGVYLSYLIRTIQRSVEASGGRAGKAGKAGKA